MKELEKIILEQTGKNIESVDKKELFDLIKKITNPTDHKEKSEKILVEHVKQNLFCNKPGHNNLGEKEFLEKEEIVQLYKKLKLNWTNNLKDKGVKMPQLYRGNSFTIDSLVLIYLLKKFKQRVSKTELSRFLKNMGTPSNNMQQARHLGQQKGWYIISGQRGDIGSLKYNLRSGDYALVSLKDPYPSYRPEKREGSLSEEEWKNIKKTYNNRCASCGSKEGEKHLYYSSHITKLTKGHMNPRESLTINNTIPQCQICNRSSLNNFIFDKKGRVKAVNNPNFINNSPIEIQKEVFKILANKFS